MSASFEVAIVGTGPAGCFLAGALLDLVPECHVTLLERLPSPYGLARNGVAPDHDSIKSVMRAFERTLLNPRVKFMGNVQAGRDVQVHELLQYYHAVVLTHGCAVDAKLGIPGEDLPGSHAATEFVGWYNGHPDFSGMKFDLSATAAAVVGQGNVAVDVARLLAKPPHLLQHTDIPEGALNALRSSNLAEVHIVGRRGPVQASFTDKELRELLELKDCDVVVARDLFPLDPEDEEELAHSSKITKRNLVLLAEAIDRPLTGASKRLYFHFYRRPVEVVGTDRVTGLRLERTRVVGPPGKRVAEGTGEYETIPCSLVFRSVGYRGQGLPGVPFDERRSTYANTHGRILHGESPVPGLYACGWIKTGARGTMGLIKADANDTAQVLVEDLDALRDRAIHSEPNFSSLLRSRDVRVVDFSMWQTLNEIEIERGKALGKPREKFVSVDDMFDALRQ